MQRSEIEMLSDPHCIQFSDGTEFRLKNIRDWSSDDCMDWALETQQKLNIPLSSWISVDGFKYLTGRELLNYTNEDFCRIVDETYGPQFHEMFTRLAKHRLEESDLMGVRIADGYSCSSPWFDPDQHHLQLPEMVSSSPNPCLSPYHDTSYSSNSSSPFPTLYPPAHQQEFTQELYSPSLDLTPLEHLNNTPFDTMNESMSDILNDLTLDENPGLSENDMNSYFDENWTGPDMDEMSARTEESCSLSPYLGLEHGQDSYQEPQMFLRGLQTGSSSVSRLSRSFALHPELASVLQEEPNSNTKMLKKVTTGKKKNRTRNPRSWEFIIRLLIDPATNPSLVRWEDKEEGTFRLMKKDEIARLWGSRSERHKNEDLSYENFARILRYHYKNGLLKPVEERHLVYKLGKDVLEDLKRKRLI